MGKYSPTYMQPQKRRSEMHPIWRGIGCLLIVFVPLISFGVSELIVQDPAIQTYIPYQLMGNPVISSKNILWKIEYVPMLLNFIQNQENLYAVIVLTLFFTLILGTFVAVVNAVMYKYIGPPQYGPQDAPPPRVRVKRYKR